MNLEPTASSSSYEDDSSSSEEEETDSPVVKASLPVTTANSSSSEEEEEETDSESETEPVHDSKDGSKPKITANSLSDSPVVKPDSSNKVEAPINTANSSSEEEEEETDSESETEQEEVEAVKPPPDSSSKVPVPTANSSSEEEEEETDSESETDPVETSPKLETTEVEADSPAVKPPTDSNKVETTKKRSIETMDEGGEAKRIKTDSGGDDDDKKITVFQETKKNYFQRVWTEEDEITVLQGIIDYQNETGSSAFDDRNALYELLKQSLSFTPTKTQFSEKIRSLKKKFENNRGKEKKRGEAPAFSKPHDLETFRLSKFVWGGDGIMSNAIEVEPPVLKLVAPAAVKKQEFGVSIVEALARFGVDNLFAKKGWSKLSLEDKKRLEVEWEALQLEELRFYSRKSRFIHDAVTKMAEASQRDH
ncbi:DNA-binding storekeeper protein-related transcriptional regulator [Raphanus sativus]|nr:DNA-binding storekeeper protein-related transcriptional regulator [Raphanus sativus]